MSWLNWNTWSRLTAALNGGTVRRRKSRPVSRNRSLRLDPLEERALLSVSAGHVDDQQIDSLTEMVQFTTAGQSIAVDHDGNFVVVWTREDPIPGTFPPESETNIYARYYTDEVQRITLPDGVRNNSNATFDLRYGGNEVQRLTLAASYEPSLPVEFQECLEGTFVLRLGMESTDNTGPIFFRELPYLWETPLQAMQRNALSIQQGLRALGGVLDDVVVVGISPRTYDIQFGDASGREAQHLLYADPNAWSFDTGFLPSIEVEKVRVPVELTDIPISPDDPWETATAIESWFAEYTVGTYTVGNTAYTLGNYDMAPINIPVPQLPLGGTTPVEVSVVPVFTLEAGMEYVTFDIMFIGNSGKIDHPDLDFRVWDGTQLLEDWRFLDSSLEGPRTIKEPSPEFRVNDPEPDNPFTTGPDKFNQTAPAVAIDADGEFVITWQSEVPDWQIPGSQWKSVTDVFARRFSPQAIVPWSEVTFYADMDRDGVGETPIQGVRPLGDQFLVNTTRANAQFSPAVGMDDDGNYVIAWVSEGQDISFFNDIWAQRFNRDGEKLGSEWQVNEIDTEIHNDPFVAVSYDGYFLVSWTMPQFASIQGALYNPEGQALTHQFSSPDHPQFTIGAGFSSTAAFDMDRNFVVGWEYRPTSDNDNIPGLGEPFDKGVYAREYGMNFNTAGDFTNLRVLRSELRVNSASFNPAVESTDWPGYQGGNQVIIDADGDLVIVYDGFGPDVSAFDVTGAIEGIVYPEASVPHDVGPDVEDSVQATTDPYQTPFGKQKLVFDDDEFGFFRLELAGRRTDPIDFDPANLDQVAEDMRVALQALRPGYVVAVTRLNSTVPFEFMVDFAGGVQPTTPIYRSQVAEPAGLVQAIPIGFSLQELEFEEDILGLFRLQLAGMWTGAIVFDPTDPDQVAEDIRLALESLSPDYAGVVVTFDEDSEPLRFLFDFRGVPAPPNALVRRTEVIELTDSDPAIPVGYSVQVLEFDDATPGTGFFHLRVGGEWTGPIAFDQTTPMVVAQNIALALEALSPDYAGVQVGTLTQTGREYRINFQSVPNPPTALVRSTEVVEQVDASPATPIGFSVQDLVFGASSPDAGFFHLRVGGTWTHAIEFAADDPDQVAENIRLALEDLSPDYAGVVVTPLGQGGREYRINFQGVPAPPAALLRATDVVDQDAAFPATPIDYSVQMLEFDADTPDAGFFYLQVGGAWTDSIEFIAGNPEQVAGNIQFALESLSGDYAGVVVKSLTQEGLKYEIDFRDVAVPPAALLRATDVVDQDAAFPATPIDFSVQILEFGADTPDSGFFDLRLAGEWTLPIEFAAGNPNQVAENIRLALEALSPNYAGVTVTSLTQAGHRYQIDFRDVPGPPSALLRATEVVQQGALFPATPLDYSVQLLKFGDTTPDSGSFHLRLAGAWTGSIAFASGTPLQVAENIRAALEALSPDYAGVVVTSLTQDGREYRIDFRAVPVPPTGLLRATEVVQQDTLFPANPVDFSVQVLEFGEETPPTGFFDLRLGAAWTQPIVFDAGDPDQVAENIKLSLEALSADYAGVVVTPVGQTGWMYRIDFTGVPSPPTGLLRATEVVEQFESVPAEPVGYSVQVLEFDEDTPDYGFFDLRLAGQWIRRVEFDRTNPSQVATNIKDALEEFSADYQDVVVTSLSQGGRRYRIDFRDTPAPPTALLAATEVTPPVVAYVADAVGAALNPYTQQEFVFADFQPGYFQVLVDGRWTRGIYFDPIDASEVADNIQSAIENVNPARYAGLSVTVVSPSEPFKFLIDFTGVPLAPTVPTTLLRRTEVIVGTPVVSFTASAVGTWVQNLTFEEQPPNFFRVGVGSQWTQPITFITGDPEQVAENIRLALEGLSPDYAGVTVISLSQTGWEYRIDFTGIPDPADRPRAVLMVSPVAGTFVADPVGTWVQDLVFEAEPPTLFRLEVADQWTTPIEFVGTPAQVAENIRLALVALSPDYANVTVTSLSALEYRINFRGVPDPLDRPDSVITVAPIAGTFTAEPVGTWVQDLVFDAQPPDFFRVGVGSQWTKPIEFVAGDPDQVAENIRLALVALSPNYANVTVTSLSQDGQEYRIDFTGVPNPVDRPRAVLMVAPVLGAFQADPAGTWVQDLALDAQTPRYFHLGIANQWTRPIEFVAGDPDQVAENIRLALVALSPSYAAVTVTPLSDTGREHRISFMGVSQSDRPRVVIMVAPVVEFLTDPIGTWVQDLALGDQTPRYFHLGIANQWTRPIEFVAGDPDQVAANIRAALEALGYAGVTVTPLSDTGRDHRIDFRGVPNPADRPRAVLMVAPVVEFSTNPAGTWVQLLEFDAQMPRFFRLGFGDEWTPPLEFIPGDPNQVAESIRLALEALSPAYVGVTVTPLAGDGRQFRVDFRGVPDPADRPSAALMIAPVVSFLADPVGTWVQDLEFADDTAGYFRLGLANAWTQPIEFVPGDSGQVAENIRLALEALSPDYTGLTVIALTLTGREYRIDFTSIPDPALRPQTVLRVTEVTVVEPVVAVDADPVGFWIQNLEFVLDEPVRGFFRVQLAGERTRAIEYIPNDPYQVAANIQNALVAMRPSYAGVTVTVASLDPRTFRIDFRGVPNPLDRPADYLYRTEEVIELISFFPGVPFGFAVQELEFADNEPGFFRIELAGQWTRAIRFDPGNPAQLGQDIQSAIEGLYPGYPGVVVDVLSTSPFRVRIDFTNLNVYPSVPPTVRLWSTEVVQPMTEGELGEFWGLLNGFYGLVRGEANGVMFSRFDTHPELGVENILASDSIGNNMRDGQNQRVIIPLDVTIWGRWQSFTLRLSHPWAAGYEDVEVQVVLNADHTVNRAATAAAIHNALEGLLRSGISWEEPPFNAGISVRPVTLAELRERRDTPWELAFNMAGAEGSFYTDDLFEVTFHGELHDTGIGISVLNAEVLHDCVQILRFTPIMGQELVGRFTLAVGGDESGPITFNRFDLPGVADSIRRELLLLGFEGVRVTVESHSRDYYEFRVHFAGESGGEEQERITGVPFVGERPFPPPLNATIFARFLQVGGEYAISPLEDEFPHPVGYTYADPGTEQAEVSIGIQPEGDYVLAWTQVDRYTDGSGAGTSLHFRTFNESTDTAGPMVTDFLLTSGERLIDGGQVIVTDPVNDPFQYIVVVFDEDMMREGRHAVTNPENWALLHDGVELPGGISRVFFGMNAASDLAPILWGGQVTGSNKWEAVIELDGNGASYGLAPLEDGFYEIVALNWLRDRAGNPLGRTGYEVNGEVFRREFHLTVPSGGETRVNTDPSGDQYTYPHGANPVASDADGDYVVVWRNEQPGHEGVYARLYQTVWTDAPAGRESNITVVTVINPATGQPWANNEIRVTSNPTATEAAVARDADGDFVVAWSQNDGTTAAPNWNIWARRFDAAGNAREDAFLVNSTTRDTQSKPAVAMDIDGDFVIVWQSMNQDGHGWGIYGQRYDTHGNPIGGINEIQVISFLNRPVGTFALRWTGGDAGTPNVTNDIEFAGNTFTIAEKVREELERLGAEVLVYAISSTELAVMFVGRYGSVDVSQMIIERATITGDPGARIEIGTRVDGAPGEFLVNETTLGNQMFPSIAMSADGTFVVSWTSSGQDGDAAYETNIYARQFVSNEVLRLSTSAATAAALNVSWPQGWYKAPLMTTVGDPDDYIVDPGEGYDGVVQIFAGGGVGSGAALLSGRHILTAAHVVTDGPNALATEDVTVVFHLEGGPVQMGVSEIFVHPLWTGDVNTGGGDLAIVVLAGSVPAGVPVYDIYRERDELDQAFRKVGYGTSGTGETGYVFYDGEKRTGLNRYDALDSVYGFFGDCLIYDFDNGLPENDLFGLEFGIHDLGLGNDEVSGAPGDSGGPNLIDGRIAAVTSWIWARPGSHDVLPGVNASFGDLGGDVRVSDYARWIDMATAAGTGEFLVNQTIADNQKWSSVAMDLSGDFVITWTSHGQDGGGSGPGPGVDGENGIFARRYDTSATAVGGEFLVNTFAEHDQQHSRAAMDADGDFVIVWESVHQDGDEWGIYLQRYASVEAMATNPYLGPNGEFQAEMRVNTTTEGNQRYPGVAVNHTGDIVVVWSGFGTGDDQGVFYQRYEKVVDDAGPVVADVFAVDPDVEFEQVLPGDVLDYYVQQFVVTFGEDLNVEDGGVNSIVNTANWGILQNGSLLFGGIANVQFGFDLLHGLYPETYAPSQKFEAIVTFDGDPTDPNWQPLEEGRYVLIVRDRVEDIFGNPFDGNYDGEPGGDFEREFVIRVGDPSTEDPPPGPGDPDEDEFDERVNESVVGNQDSPRVASNAVGDYVVVWVTYGSDTDWSDEGNIVGQRYTAAGTKVGAEFTVNTFTTGTQIQPDVAMDSYGNFVVTWSGEGDSDDSGVWARAYDAFGVPLGQQFRVNQVTQNAQNEPAIAMRADGSFVVTWTSYGQDIRTSNTTTSIFARIFNSVGTPLTSEFLVNTFEYSSQENSHVAAGPNGTFIIVWQSWTQDGNQTGVYGQRFDAAGNKLGSEFLVNTRTGDKQQDPRVAIDASGNFVVVYNDFGNDASGGWGVYARRYNAAGVALDAQAFLVNQFTLGYQWQPSVDTDDAGHFVVTWSTFGQDRDDFIQNQDFGIYARMFNADGSDWAYPGAEGVLGEFRVNATVVGNQVTPDVALAANGNYVIVWVGPDGSGTGIFHRPVGASTSNSPGGNGDDDGDTGGTIGAGNGGSVITTFDLAGRIASNGDWWLGESNGVDAFTNSKVTRWNPNLELVDIMVGDFTGSGLDDIVGRIATTGDWWVAVNNGDGTFTNQKWTRWNPSLELVDVMAADFTGDGVADI
ncbi:MAG: trypsin-like serine protease, partial [Thermoguttaceae bacterium]|nr:trypsin-like serine protease [Thermoguttaceae bacterium]